MTRARLEIAPGCFVAPNVVELASVGEGWNRYCALIQAQRNDERLLKDMPHQKKIALALWDLHILGGI